jgi:hypothetical protein
MDFDIFDPDSHQPIPSDDPDPRFSNVYHKSEVSSDRRTPRNDDVRSESMRWRYRHGYRCPALSHGSHQRASTIEGRDVVSPSGGSGLRRLGGCGLRRPRSGNSKRGYGGTHQCDDGYHSRDRPSYVIVAIHILMTGNKARERVNGHREIFNSHDGREDTNNYQDDYC